MQADASKEANLSRIFARSNGQEFDYVFNCGGETRYSQDDEVYKARSHTLSVCLGKEAARRKIKCFLEVSTGMVYKPKEKPRKEGDDLKPWLKLAKWKLQAEQDLSKIGGLRLCVLRLGHVYGSYTSKYLAMALCLARVWQHEGETMKWLWGRDLRNNTVHVEDVARGMWHAAEWYCNSADVRTRAPIFNLVDQGNTCESLPQPRTPVILTTPSPRNISRHPPTNLQRPTNLRRQRPLQNRHAKTRQCSR